MSSELKDLLIAALSNRAESGQPVQFWLRDDDATEPSEALDKLIAITTHYSVPLTLAVIPAHSGPNLALHVAQIETVAVAVHGWSHHNHAGLGEKKQELGNHRPNREVFAELTQAFTHLQSLYGAQFIPLLVPPWNRISPSIVQGLTDIGFRGLSTFGAETPAPISMINTHIDLIDWKGSRGGRNASDLFAELIELVSSDNRPIGFLTHHLVHDDAAWNFLEQLFAIINDQSGASWVPVNDLLPS